MSLTSVLSRVSLTCVLAWSLYMSTWAWAQDRPVPKTISVNIREAVAAIYGQEELDTIYNNIEEAIHNARQERDLALVLEDYKRVQDWYKDEVVYMFYADQLGVRNDGSGNTFADLISMFDYLEDLGVTVLWVLPFMESPMGDAGFDVSDAKNVRKELGGLSQFQDFAREARRRRMKLKADLVLNHVSEQHEWFQAAIRGDVEKIQYFMVRDDHPEFKRYTDPQRGVVVDYKEDGNIVSSRRLIFPFASETHFRPVKIGDQEHFFYHTFYPFQLDVNWSNPAVLYEVLDIIAFWANQGIDILRLDAAPFFIKKAGTDGENLPETYEVVKLLSSFLQAIAPRSVLHIEAVAPPKELVAYFGEQETNQHNMLGQQKQIVRTDEVQMSYHFPYAPAIWTTLVTRDPSHFWKVHAETPELPSTASWSVFLRLHDELNFEKLDRVSRKLVYEALESKGLSFRGGLGLGGRLADFLDRDVEKIGLAFAILFSMPGTPIVYYGDEIGVGNNPDYAAEAAKMRRAAAQSPTADLASFFDARDIHRGPVSQESLTAAMQGDDVFARRIFETVRNLANIRLRNPVLSRGKLNRVETDRKLVFSYMRQLGPHRVLVLNNLADKPVVTAVDLDVEQTSLSLSNALSDEPLVARRNEDGHFVFSLEPYQALWVQL